MRKYKNTLWWELRFNTYALISILLSTGFFLWFGHEHDTDGIFSIWKFILGFIFMFISALLLYLAAKYD